VPGDQLARGRQPVARAAARTHVRSDSAMRVLLPSFMSADDSATAPAVRPLPDGAGAGLWWGLLGVVAFSLTVPLTRIAVADASPLFVGAGRAVVAAALAGAALALARERLPRRDLRVRLVLVAGGVVVGFPLLTSFAMVTVPATHGAVVIALLPAATAVTAAVRGHERSRCGSGCSPGSAQQPPSGSSPSGRAVPAGCTRRTCSCCSPSSPRPSAMPRAVCCAGSSGAWQTVSWALVLAAPLMVVLTVVSAPGGMPSTPGQWGAFAYLGVVSMFLGFFAWYRGLALGPMAQVSQVQLVQPVLSIGWAALLLSEALTWGHGRGRAPGRRLRGRRGAGPPRAPR
jgi:drug/metabolite transporter (DMT)-like permease